MVLTGVVLAARRRPYELAVLIAGSVLIYVGVQLAKAGVDRPRPPRPLASKVSGSSYPSGHAAYSTAWVAAGAALTRVLPGLASRTGLIIVGLLVAGAVGVSRIYLRVHYWSDVVGGWGLGFGVFGTCATVALIVAFFRHNGEA
jgi:membrane-associated phospholipid phosphatase